MAPSIPLPGDVVAEKYEVVRVLGQGGMGVVVEARHRRLQHRVAIKFLMPEEVARPDAIARFGREARAAAQLQSPHVVRVVDVDTTADGLPFIVMEYLEGRDVGTELRERSQIPVPEAVDWILQACAAMAEAHACGIVHRDLKPGNLFLCEAPRQPLLKVMDFGVSKVAERVPGEIDLTTTETAVGTPSYMAPEQLISAKTLDHRADVWALGIVLYKLVSGQLPFTGPTPTAIAIAIATSVPVPVSKMVPSLPAPLAAAIMKALARDPADRHRDVLTFARSIEPFGSGAFSFDAALPATSIREAWAAATAEGDGATRSNWSNLGSSVTVGAKRRQFAVVGVALAAAMTAGAATLAWTRSHAPSAAASLAKEAPPPAFPPVDPPKADAPKADAPKADAPEPLVGAPLRAEPSASAARPSVDPGKKAAKPSVRPPPAASSPTAPVRDPVHL